MCLSNENLILIINCVRVLKLKNGLTALLISDPIINEAHVDTFYDSAKSTQEVNVDRERETDVEKLGACSVCVDVG